MATKICLYCGLHLPDTTTFCPECGRPIERGFEIRPIQESKIDCPHKKLKSKDNLPRQQEFNCDNSGRATARPPILVRQTSCDNLHVGASLADARLPATTSHDA
jgi:predicted amidophosphoribosyltransferase